MTETIDHKRSEKPFCFPERAVFPEKHDCFVFGKDIQQPQREPGVVEIIVTVRRFEEAGFSTAENDAYAGCMVPNAALRGACDCVSVMLEFHKRTYLDTSGKARKEQAERIRETIGKVISDSMELDF